MTLRGSAALVFLALAACGARTNGLGPPDAAPDGDPCDFDATLPPPRVRECGLGPRQHWCGACKPPGWCDQPNGQCRKPAGSCKDCPEESGCTLNGRCTAPPCEGPCEEKVLVPEGEVLLGDPEWGDEEPWAEWLPAFRIDRYEVTIARYRRCVSFSACGAPTDDHVELYVPGAFRDEAYDLFPVSRVKPYDAETFCAWDGGWLPTRADWVKAARGGCEVRGSPACLVEEGDAAPYPWGDEPPDCTRTNGGDPDSGEYCAGRPERVGSFPAGASPYGAEDMLGNVGEMVDEGCGLAPWCTNDSEWDLALDRHRIWRAAGMDGNSIGDGFRCAYPP